MNVDEYMMYENTNRVWLAAKKSCIPFEMPKYQQEELTVSSLEQYQVHQIVLYHHTVQRHQSWHSFQRELPISGKHKNNNTKDMSVRTCAYLESWFSEYSTSKETNEQQKVMNQINLLPSQPFKYKKYTFATKNIN